MILFQDTDIVFHHNESAYDISELFTDLTGSVQTTLVGSGQTHAKASVSFHLLKHINTSLIYADYSSLPFPQRPFELPLLDSKPSSNVCPRLEGSGLSTLTQETLHFPLLAAYILDMQFRPADPDR